MKYLMISQFPPIKSGIATYAYQAVAKLRQANNEVDVLSPQGGNAKFIANLVGGFNPLKIIKYSIGYDKIILQYHHILFYRPKNRLDRIATTISLLLVFLLFRNLEIICHESRPPTPPIKKGILRNLGYWLDITLMRACFKIAPKIIFHTNKEKTKLEEEFNIKLTRYKIREHHKDFIKYTDISKSQARKRLKIRQKDTVLLCIGFIGPHKGFDRAIKAFNKVSNPNVKLYIVGSLLVETDETIKYLSYLKKLAKGNENIKIIDKHLTDEVFDCWIIAADYILLPYRWISSSGILARARLFKKPVIISKVGGLEEQIDKTNSIIFESDKELETIIKSLG
jgi:glycosyltransferase involved in cell wall biosynthesis